MDLLQPHCKLQICACVLFPSKKSRIYICTLFKPYMYNYQNCGDLNTRTKKLYTSHMNLNK